MSRKNLSASARYVAENPRDMQIGTYASKEPMYIEVMSHDGYNVLTFRSYMYDEATDTYYCYILGKMHEQDVCLPDKGQLINLKLPIEVIKKGVTDSTTKQVLVHTIEKNKNSRVAKINSIN